MRFSEQSQSSNIPRCIESRCAGQTWAAVKILPRSLRPSLTAVLQAELRFFCHRRLLSSSLRGSAVSSQCVFPTSHTLSCVSCVISVACAKSFLQSKQMSASLKNPLPFERRVWSPRTGSASSLRCGRPATADGCCNVCGRGL